MSATKRAIMLSRLQSKVAEARASPERTAMISGDRLEMIYQVLHAAHRILEDAKNVHCLEALHKAFEELTEDLV